jgi:spore coat protein CotF
MVYIVTFVNPEVINPVSKSITADSWDDVMTDPTVKYMLNKGWYIPPDRVIKFKNDTRKERHHE